MLKTVIVNTDDGSHTLYQNDIDEHYHSTFGAFTESRHIFIEQGLKAVNKRGIHVFEMGFGTGLNCLLSYIEAEKSNKKVMYHTIENHPLDIENALQLNYSSLLGKQAAKVFHNLHTAKWDTDIQMSDFFNIRKINQDINDYTFDDTYDIVYYDAFSPKAQPEVWQYSIFRRIYEHLNDHGFIITYCVKGEVKALLVKCGFHLQKLPGPPKGKREILKAIKK